MDLVTLGPYAGLLALPLVLLVAWAGWRSQRNLVRQPAMVAQARHVERLREALEAQVALEKARNDDAMSQLVALGQQLALLHAHLVVQREEMERLRGTQIERLVATEVERRSTQEG